MAGASGHRLLGAAIDRGRVRGLHLGHHPLDFVQEARRPPRDPGFRRPAGPSPAFAGVPPYRCARLRLLNAGDWNADSIRTMGSGDRVTTEDRKFRVGDKVRVRDGGRTVWTVVGDDTNRTPTVDLQPAYRLQHGTHQRYAYEADLERTEPRSGVGGPDPEGGP